MNREIANTMQPVEELHGIIYVGRDNSQLADELERDAREMGIRVTDTMLKIENGPEVLKWYMKNTSISTVLIRKVSDLATEPEVQNDILLEAKRNGITINVKEMGWKPVESIPCDGSAEC